MQDYSSGFFTAYEHLAGENVDFVVHLSDFVYEYDFYPGSQTPKEKRLDQSAAVNDDYRKIRNIQKRPYLQHALEKHTFIYTWDDHETANDHRYDRETDSYTLSDEHPLFDSNPEEGRQLV